MHFENMYRELTNLLPSERSRAVRHEYFLRLATVALVFGIFLVAAHAALLLPAYLTLADQIQTKEIELASRQTSLDSREEQEVRARLSALEENATFIKSLANRPSGTAIVRTLLSVPHSGISITGFTYAAPKDGSAGRFILTGTATHRDNLRSYVFALNELPYVDKAELPYSAYTKETEVPFTITLSGKLIP